jgi:hypothetical protein
MAGASKHTSAANETVLRVRFCIGFHCDARCFGLTMNEFGVYGPVY